MKEPQEYKLTQYPKATIRSVCQGENVSSQTNTHTHTHTHTHTRAHTQTYNISKLE